MVAGGGREQRYCFFHPPSRNPSPFSTQVVIVQYPCLACRSDHWEGDSVEENGPEYTVISAHRPGRESFYKQGFLMLR